MSVKHENYQKEILHLRFQIDEETLDVTCLERNAYTPTEQISVFKNEIVQPKPESNEAQEN